MQSLVLAKIKNWADNLSTQLIYYYANPSSFSFAGVGTPFSSHPRSL